MVIKRCPVCNRILIFGKCREHGRIVQLSGSISSGTGPAKIKKIVGSLTVN